MNSNKKQEVTTSWMARGTATILGILLVVCALNVERVFAQAADADSLTITITPNVDFGVRIDTSAVVLDLGTIDLYASTQTVEPATVTILGTVASDGSESTGQELDMSLTFGGGWTFDSTPSTWSTGGVVDEIAVYALFSDTSLSDFPNGDDFENDGGGFTAGVQRAGGHTNNAGVFEKAGTGAIDMDHRSPANEAHLWMFLRLPPATATGGAKTITVTATALQAS